MKNLLLPDENSYRFIAILNEKIEIGKLMNALGHMAAGLAGGFEKVTTYAVGAFRRRNLRRSLMYVLHTLALLLDFSLHCTQLRKS